MTLGKASPTNSFASCAGETKLLPSGKESAILSPTELMRKPAQLLQNGDKKHHLIHVLEFVRNKGKRLQEFFGCIIAI